MIAPIPVRGTALAGLLTLLALPTAAHAAGPPTGGVAPGPPAAPATPPPAPPPASPAPPTTASARLAGAGTWTASPSPVSGRPVRIAGTFRRGLAGRAVQVQRRTPTGRWLRATSTRVRSTGRFSVTWKTASTAVQTLRVVVVASTRAHAGSRVSLRAKAAPSVRISVLGRGKATWYGPGFYGRTTACGLRLERATVGVAHRTLPCGTQLEVRRAGRSVVVPVIDRGPFAHGASLDLTRDPAEALALDGVGAVTFVQRDDLPKLDTPADAPPIRG